MLRLLLTFTFFAAIASCAPLSSSRSSDKLVLKKTTFREIAGWEGDNHSEALTVFLKSCNAFATQSDTAIIGQGKLSAPAVVWESACRKGQLVPEGNEALAREFFETSFIPMHATNNDNSAGLLTGYYEPVIKGARRQQPPFVYPIYALPPAGTPSYTRSQIDHGSLGAQATIIAYTDDPVQLFFLHIQGSGSIQLESGETLHIGYAGTNGQPYVAIGHVLVNKGIFKKQEITMPLLRQWLYDNPDQMWPTMWENTSYIFFRELKGKATIGAQKVPLTADRSLAVDAYYIPLGMPVFLDALLPDTPSSPMAIQRKLFVAQDTGSAIRGPTRGDIFFGTGLAAEQLAGRMKAGGDWTLLVPRALAITILKTSQ